MEAKNITLIYCIGLENMNYSFKLMGQLHPIQPVWEGKRYVCLVKPSNPRVFEGILCRVSLGDIELSQLHEDVLR